MCTGSWVGSPQWAVSEQRRGGKHGALLWTPTLLHRAWSRKTRAHQATSGSRCRNRSGTAELPSSGLSCSAGVLPPSSPVHGSWTRNGLQLVPPYCQNVPRSCAGQTCPGQDGRMALSFPLPWVHALPPVPKWGRDFVYDRISLLELGDIFLARRDFSDIIKVANQLT